MPQAIGYHVENAFNKGVITEATGLNFPEKACTDALNCRFDAIGNVTRRNGFQLEDSFEGFGINPSGAMITEYIWRSVSQEGQVSILVLQVGTTLSFYNLGTSETLSADRLGFSVSLNTFRAAGAPDPGTEPCGYSIANGWLVVTHPYCDPFWIEYDPETSTIDTGEINIKIRDMKGLDASTDLGLTRYNERPTQAVVAAARPGAGDRYLYNLLNQGWIQKIGAAAGNIMTLYNNGQQIFNNSEGYIDPQNANFGALPALDAWNAGSQSYTEPTQGQTASYTQRTDWPAEAEVWWLYQFAQTTRATLDVTSIDKMPLPNSPSAKGHFIYNAFSIDRGAVAMAEYIANNGAQFSALNLDIVSAGYFRPAVGVPFAGRMFYAGMSVREFNSNIWFTKVVEKKEDLEKCHQLSDPANQDEGMLVASDGGVIVIPEVALIVKLFATGSSLIVFATNGIWKISGGLGATGFSADAYTISRISTIDAQSSLSFVDVDGMPIWWNNDGIWTLKADQLGTKVEVVSLSLTTIQTYIDSIPADNKRFIKGAFNPFSRIVQWLYREDEADDLAESFKYTHVMNLNMMTGAFYWWELPDDADTATHIAGVFVPLGTVIDFSDETVVDSTGATVVDSTSATVTISVGTTVSVNSLFKYLVIGEVVDESDAPTTWLSSGNTMYNKVFGLSRSPTGQSVFLPATTAAAAIQYMATDAQSPATAITSDGRNSFGRVAFKQTTAGGAATHFACLSYSAATSNGFLNTYTVAGALTSTQITTFPTTVVGEGNVGGSNLTWWTDNNLYYSALDTFAGHYVIWRVSSTGTNLTNILDGGAGVDYDHPALGNDGTDFMIVQRTVAGVRTWWRCTTAGTGLTQITFDHVDTITRAANINILPGGQYMVFQADCSAGHARQLIFSNIDGSDCIELAGTGDTAFWTLSGQGVAVDIGGSFDLRVIWSVDDAGTPTLYRAYQVGYQVPFQVTFATEENTGLIDWPHETEGDATGGAGWEYSSYLIGGYKLRGDAIRKWQSTWLTLWFKTADGDENIIDFNGQYDFANDSTIHRWSTTQRLNLSAAANLKYDYRSRRMKVRGQGKALQFRITSVDQNQFNLVGWSAMDTANQVP